MRLIDADALKEKYQRYCRMYGLKPIWKFIDNAPTVDLKDIYQEGHYDGHLEGYTKAINEERPQGHWCEMDPCSGSTFQCSECGGEIKTYYKPKFCEFCGADMRGDNE